MKKTASWRIWLVAFLTCWLKKLLIWRSSFPRLLLLLRAVEPLKSLALTLVLLIALPQVALAREWRAGAGLGFGGSGIEKRVTQGGSERVVYRAESPGVVNLFLETMYSERIVLGLEHARGFRLGPLSTGLGFTSLSTVWHYMGPAPDVTASPAREREILVRQWSPYTGGAVGFAFGTIYRDNEEVTSVSDSGVHIGIKNGVDALWRKNIGLRLEVEFLFTISQDKLSPALLSHFGLWAGVFFPVF